jgi:hypothetical protein
MNKLNRIAAAFAISATLYSCSSEEPPKSVAHPVTKTVLPQPFRFHKAVEVKPGLTFDVLSWGRGAEELGAYLILRSDSANIRYKSTSGELEGKIRDAWNMDLDSDGNPEIFIQATGTEKGNYLNMYVYEFADGGSAQQLRFPELTSSSKRNYHGRDSIFIKDGSLFRQFPVFDEADTAATKPTGVKLLEYSLRGNSFSVKEIKDEKKE